MNPQVISYETVRERSVYNDASTRLDDPDCPVCMAPMADRRHIRFECLHQVCYECLRGMFKINRQLQCPLCRTEF